MANFSVHEWIGGEQSETANDCEDRTDWNDWEGDIYRLGCAYARKLARERLEELDRELMLNRPSGLVSIGKRDRTIATAFGDLKVSRRMYRDADGETIFPLDEYLGWKPGQLASPSLAEDAAWLATLMPFRTAAAVMDKLTAGTLSKTTVHRTLQRVGEEALSEERERAEAQFERGEDVCAGSEETDILYVEADGVWVSLQREDKKRHEVKSGIAYSGRRKVGVNRCELTGKRVYCHASDDVSFWEGASLEWGKQYALDAVKLFVVGGDGANWIRAGVDFFGNAEFQLDGFHLSRDCGRGFGGELGPATYDAMREGDSALARALMSAADEPETETSRRARRRVDANVEVGMDWRVRVPGAPAGALGLGTMESNGDKLTANRMKKRGMAWTKRGANLMSKAIQVCRNGELSRRCRGRVAWERESAAVHAPSVVGPRSRISDWAEASVPALRGPSASEPWASGLRRLIHGAAY